MKSAAILLLLFAVVLSACTLAFPALQPTPDPKVLGAELDALVQEKNTPFNRGSTNPSAGSNKKRNKGN